jgi:hypothetical protein
MIVKTKKQVQDVTAAANAHTNPKSKPVVNNEKILRQGVAFNYRPCLPCGIDNH